MRPCNMRLPIGLPLVDFSRDSFFYCVGYAEHSLGSGRLGALAQLHLQHWQCWGHGFKSRMLHENISLKKTRVL